MSTISSLGSDQSVFSTLSNLAAGQQQVSQANASTGTAASSNQSGSTQTVHGGHHHHGGGKDGALFNQLQSAVSSALESAQADGTETDPNQIVQDTIAKVLNGQQNGSTGSTSSSADPSAPTTTSSTESKAAFQQLLASNGIDAQQFQQDFQAAIQSAQNGGSSDASSIYSNFPPGSAVDTTA
jgi:hypothetical protein